MRNIFEVYTTSVHALKRCAHETNVVLLTSRNTCFKSTVSQEKQRSRRISKWWHFATGTQQNLIFFSWRHCHIASGKSGRQNLVLSFLLNINQFSSYNEWNWNEKLIFNSRRCVMFFFQFAIDFIFLTLSSTLQQIRINADNFIFSFFYLQHIIIALKVVIPVWIRSHRRQFVIIIPRIHLIW